MNKLIDLTSQRFGRLTVIKRAENTKKNEPQWECECDCGNTSIVKGKRLRDGTTKSCGCYRKDVNTKHGHRQDRLYKIWAGMKSRCTDVNCNSFSRYGGRGIIVCDEWLNNFQDFYDWSMLHGYSERLSIDRINVNGNYEPSNCRWVSVEEQANNKRNNHLVTYKGKTQTIAQIAKEYGVNYKKFHRRITTYNWSIEKALNTP